MDHSKLTSTSELRPGPQKTESEIRLIHYYYECLEQLEKNNIEIVAQSLALRRSQPHLQGSQRGEQWIQRLLSIRINLKKSVATDQLRLMINELNSPNDLYLDKTLSVDKNRVAMANNYYWITGECYFVRGLICYHLGEMSQGQFYFKSASQYFLQESFYSRMALSLFNQHAGSFADTNNSLAAEELTKLIELEKYLFLTVPKVLDSHIARIISDQERLHKVEAMIHRQKAWCFERLERTSAAIEELKIACRMFELFGPKSDFHLSLIQMADLFLCEGKNLEAMSCYQKIFRPVDERVLFPLAFLEWRLFKKTIELNSFNVIIPSWKIRYEARRTESIVPDSIGCRTNQQKPNSQNLSFWQENSRTITVKNTKIVLAKNSLEGRLISILLNGKATKFLLSESLWPELVDTKVLDHRLHQLINRIKGKIGPRINFDGQFYSLDLES